MLKARKRVLAKSVEKRMRILDAAAKVLARRGYAEMTLSEIAAEVGTYAGSIYYYFPSREDLVREVLTTSLSRTSAEIMATVEAMPPDGTPLERLKMAIRAVVGMNVARNDYSIAFRRTFNQVPEILAGDIRLGRKKIRGQWKELLKSAQDAGQIHPDVDINLATLFLQGSTNWVTNWYEPDGRYSPEEIADNFTETLLNGLVRKSS